MSSKSRPPCKRYLQVFNRVVVEGQTAAEVAAELGLTLRSVQTIVARVCRWVRQHGGKLVKIDRSMVSLANARELQVARLEHQWEELMSAWHRSTQPVEREKGYYNEARVMQKVEKTRAPQNGNINYLIQARKVLGEICSLRSTSLDPLVTEEDDVEKLTPEERLAGIDQILETVDQRPGAAKAGRVDEGEEPPPDAA